MISKLVDEGVISVLKEGSYLSFILSDDELFSQVGYRMMRSQDKELFVQSVRVKHNGKTKLIYAIDGYKSLSEIISESEILECWDMLFKVSDGIIQIRNNGFLSCENLLGTFDTIFFDVETMKPHFVYLPLVCGNTENVNQSFEKLFNIQIREVIESAQQITEDEKNEVINMLCKDVLTIGEVCHIAYCHVDKKNTMKSNPYGKEFKGISLVSLDKRKPINFFVTGDKFTIGRCKDNDGVIDFSKQISRIHCSLIRQDGRYGIIDENSKNGTEVNNTKCVPGRFYEIHEDDIIKLPTISFKVHL